MTDSNKTAQEVFWASSFGGEYTLRNKPEVNARQPFFERCLQLTGKIDSVLEIGANRGHNLQAIQMSQSDVECHGLEINPGAFEILSSLDSITAHHGSVHEFNPDREYDLVFSCGVLIHLMPERLPDTYDRMFRWARKYILINEYFNPTPIEIGYRGHTGKLFKRDFGGEFWDQHSDQLELVDYGFLWKRVNPAWDDSTWWIFRKR